MALLQAWGLTMGTDLSPKGAKLMECDAELSSGKTISLGAHLRKGVGLMGNRAAFLPEALSSPREGSGLESGFHEKV